MTEGEYHQTIDRVERLLNDPTVDLDARLVWSLLADIAGQNPREPDLPAVV